MLAGAGGRSNRTFPGVKWEARTADTPGSVRHRWIRSRRFRRIHGRIVQNKIANVLERAASQPIYFISALLMKQSVNCPFFGKLRDRFCGPEAVKIALGRPGLSVSAVNANIKPDTAEFVHGSMTSPDPLVRERAVEYIHRAKDAAAVSGAERVTCCPLSDGHDHAFPIRHVTEFLFYVKELGYDGWITSDVAPMRQSAAEILALSVRVTRQIRDWLDEIDRAEIRERLQAQDFIGIRKLMEPYLFPLLHSTATVSIR